MLQFTVNACSKRHAFSHACITLIHEVHTWKKACSSVYDNCGLNQKQTLFIIYRKLVNYNL